MRRLVLYENDGKLFESIYYLAMTIASPKLAQEYYDKRPPRAKPLDRYWQNAFNAIDGTENVLVSAIVNTLNMPFGAYVLTERAADKLEIAPWLLSGKVDGKMLEEEVLADEIDAEALMSYARKFALTSDFLTWLEKQGRKYERRG